MVFLKSDSSSAQVQNVAKKHLKVSLETETPDTTEERRTKDAALRDAALQNSALKISLCLGFMITAKISHRRKAKIRNQSCSQTIYIFFFLHVMFNK